VSRRLPAVVVALLCGLPAHANIFETLGFGPRAIGMAGAVTADANDYSASWYNPAMLVTRTDANVGLGFNWQHVGASVSTLDPNQSARLDCTECQPVNAYGFSAGAIFPLGGKVKNRIALGAGAYIPAGPLLSTQAPDANRPFWYLYTGSPERLVVVGSIGVRITDWLSIGAGVQSLADLVGNGAQVSLNVATQAVTFREVNSHLEGRSAPLAGILFQPLPRLRLGMSYRGDIRLLFSIPATVNLAGIGALDFTTSAITHYSPHTFTWGAAFDVLPRLTVTADSNLALWNQAPSPYLNLTTSLSGPALQALGLNNLFNLSAQNPSPRFLDTLSMRVGAEYRLDEHFTFRGGGFFLPTPVPAQNARLSNILDSDSVGLTGGVAASFPDPLEVFQRPLTLELALQWATLAGRQANKDVADIVPPYQYSASTVGLNASMRYAF
jgi:long-chain fatty acid transport protein